MTSPSTSLGLVLSGGGSKGLAHAGVLKFLEEVNLKVTRIAGTSAGSIIGALYSWGKTPEEILEFFQSIYLFHWRHFTYKKPGIIDSAAFKPYFQTIFQDATLADLPIPLQVTATDLVRGSLTVFDPKVQIVDAILASAAFPGILSPYEFNGTIYSDGGILNHFPSDLLQGHCDKIIGVYVSPLQTISADQLTSIKSVTTRIFNILSANMNMHKFTICDWVIEPKALSKFSAFEINKAKLDTIFDIGYTAAKQSYRDTSI